MPALRLSVLDRGPREVVILTITYEHEARRRSYELIAEEVRAAGGDRRGRSQRRRLGSARARRPIPFQGSPSSSRSPTLPTVQRSGLSLPFDSSSQRSGTATGALGLLRTV